MHYALDFSQRSTRATIVHFNNVHLVSFIHTIDDARSNYCNIVRRITHKSPQAKMNGNANKSRKNNKSDEHIKMEIKKIRSNEQN